MLPLLKIVVFRSWRNPNSFIKNSKFTLEDACATDNSIYLLSYFGIFSITEPDLEISI